MENPGNQPTSIDIAMTRRAIVGLVRGDTNTEDYQAVGEVQADLITLLAARRATYINMEEARAIAVLTSLAQSGEIKRDAAERVANLLLSQGNNLPEAGFGEGLKIDIEEVVKYARVEVADTVEREKAVASRPLTPGLSQLERAAVNLEVIQGWAGEDTWLQQYLARKNKEIVLDSRRQLLIPTSIREFAFLPFYPMIMTFDAVRSLLNKGLYLNQKGVNRGWPDYNRFEGITKYYPNSILVSISRVQQEWDQGQKSLAQDLANLNMVNAATNILKAIN